MATSLSRCIVQAAERSPRTMLFQVLADIGSCQVL